MITFAIVGHNEADTVADAVAQARSAAEPGDEVVFVDSASTDDSAAVAAAAGAKVEHAPLGKGAAMQAALLDAAHPWMCFLDADIFSSERNIASTLARQVREGTDADMVLGDFGDKHGGGVLSNTWGIYEPLIAELFPEAATTCSKPLTGFRAVRTGALGDLQTLPPDFGIEARLNIDIAVDGAGAAVVDLGWYEGRFLYKPLMGREIGAAVLDSAVARGRLDATQRSAWVDWIDGVVEVIRSYRGEPEGREAFIERLGVARARPLPPAGPQPS